MPQMGTIQVSVASPKIKTGDNSSPSWGAVYWQYFEDLDKITSSATPLSINKKLFVQKNTETGTV
jgi:hypothetical protein